jgi:ribosomal protein S12 methylthiotransferase accessory factor
MSALELACSRYVGIVVHVDELLAAPDDSRLTHVVAVGADASGPLEPGGSGYAASPADARAAALGEAVERYAASNVPDGLPLARSTELSGTVEPERFALFAPEQHDDPGFPFAPFTSRTRVRWTPGRGLADGSRVFLPAQLVYLGDARGVSGEERIGYATSSGLACGASFASAALSALLELVERDAFLVAWRGRLSLPLLDARSDPALGSWERRYVAGTRLRHDVVDLSRVHGVPTALAVVRDVAGSLAVGAAAGVTIAVAYRKALAEAYASHGAARRMRGDAETERIAADVSSVVSFGDHIRLYAVPAAARRAHFLVSGGGRQPVEGVQPLEGGDPHEHLDALARRLQARGIDSYAVDVTTPDVAELGLHVVRVVAPELCPLDVRQDACFLGGARLRDAPVELGFRDRPLTFDGLNRDPHPFP